MDRLVNFLFRWNKLRLAIFNEVHIYDKLRAMFDDPKASTTSSSIYSDIDGWRGWHKSLSIGRYYFNDIPEDAFMDAWNELHLMEVRAFQLEFDLDEVW
jgi:hypothetical protein